MSPVWPLGLPLVLACSSRANHDVTLLRGQWRHGRRRQRRGGKRIAVARVVDIEGAEAHLFDRPWPRHLRFVMMELHPSRYPDTVIRAADDPAF